MTMIYQPTEEPVHFHNWIGDGWAIRFSKNFMPICTTTLGEVARLNPAFDKLDVGLSGDPSPSTGNGRMTSKKHKG
jgi:thioredoxin-dependent peroxiredoxin